MPRGEQRYFDGMLYIMSMLHCSGNFRIIEPATQNSSKPRSTERHARWMPSPGLPERLRAPGRQVAANPRAAASG